MNRTRKMNDARKRLRRAMKRIRLAQKYPIKPQPPPPETRWVRNPIYLPRGYKGYIPGSGTIVWVD